MFSPDKSILLIIDVQGKLAELVSDSKQVLGNIQILIQIASYLNIPIIVTEQVSEKIGKTIDKIYSLIPDSEVIVKRTFSCCGEQRFLKALNEYDRDEIIVTGIESHVCVYQTVYDLLNQSYKVKFVKDAISSRREIDSITAMDQMTILGATPTTTEMLACELIKGADHKNFKDIMKFLKS